MDFRYFCSFDIRPSPVRHPLSRRYVHAIAYNLRYFFIGVLLECYKYLQIDPSILLIVTQVITNLELLKIKL